MSIFRTVFLGTPDFAQICLQGMLNDKRFQVVGVVTQPDRPRGRKMQLSPCVTKQLAVEYNIPVISPENINDEVVLDQIKSWGAEAAVVVAYGQIMRPNFLQMFPQKVVNVHGSLLPHLRGAAPIQRAVMNGDTEAGVALQVMVQKLDAGDILGVRRTPITDDKDALTLHDELASLGSELLALELFDYLRGNLVAEPQDEANVTFAAKLEKSEGKINWTQSAANVFNLIRGMKMGPGTYTFFNGKKLKIHQTTVLEATGNPGEVIDLLPDGFVVACAEGSLKLIEVQPESKPKMLAADFIRGYQIKIGDQLGE